MAGHVLTGIAKVKSPSEFWPAALLKGWPDDCTFTATPTTFTRKLGSGYDEDYIHAGLGK